MQGKVLYLSIMLWCLNDTKPLIVILLNLIRLICNLPVAQDWFSDISNGEHCILCLKIH